MKYSESLELVIKTIFENYYIKEEDKHIVDCCLSDWKNDHFENWFIECRCFKKTM